MTDHKDYHNDHITECIHDDHFTYLCNIGWHYDAHKFISTLIIDFEALQYSGWQLGKIMTVWSFEWSIDAALYMRMKTLFTSHPKKKNKIKKWVGFIRYWVREQGWLQMYPHLKHSETMQGDSSMMGHQITNTAFKPVHESLTFGITTSGNVDEKLWEHAVHLVKMWIYILFINKLGSSPASPPFPPV